MLTLIKSLGLNYIPAFKVSFFLGLTNSATSILNAFSFVCVVSFINGGNGFLERWFDINPNVYLFLSVLFLIWSSMMYSLIKNTNYNLKRTINLCYRNARVKKEINSIVNSYKQHSFLAVRTFFLLFIPPSVVVCISVMLMSFFSLLLAGVALLSVVISVSILAFLLSYFNKAVSEEVVPFKLGLLISGLASATLIMPAVSLAYQVNHDIYDPALIVLLVFLLRYVFSFTRLVMFAYYRISYNLESEKTFEGNGRRYIPLIMNAKHAVISPADFSSLIKDVKNTLSNDSSSAKITSVVIGEKKHFCLTCHKRVVIKDVMLNNYKKAELLEFLTKTKKSFLIVSANSEFQRKLGLK